MPGNEIVSALAEVYTAGCLDGEPINVTDERGLCEAPVKPFTLHRARGCFADVDGRFRVGGRLDARTSTLHARPSALHSTFTCQPASLAAWATRVLIMRCCGDQEVLPDALG
jgi:hypothetical protein